MTHTNIFAYKIIKFQVFLIFLLFRNTQKTKNNKITLKQKHIFYFSSLIMAIIHLANVAF